VQSTGVGLQEDPKDQTLNYMFEVGSVNFNLQLVLSRLFGLSSETLLLVIIIMLHASVLVFWTYGLGYVKC